MDYSSSDYANNVHKLMLKFINTVRTEKRFAQNDKVVS